MTRLGEKHLQTDKNFVIPGKVGNTVGAPPPHRMETLKSSAIGRLMVPIPAMVHGRSLLNQNQKFPPTVNIQQGAPSPVEEDLKSLATGGVRAPHLTIASGIKILNHNRNFPPAGYWERMTRKPTPQYFSVKYGHRTKIYLLK